MSIVCQLNSNKNPVEEPVNSRILQLPFNSGTQALNDAKICFFLLRKALNSTTVNEMSPTIDVTDEDSCSLMNFDTCALSWSPRNEAILKGNSSTENLSPLSRNMD
jgi:hypothetical protein